MIIGIGSDIVSVKRISSIVEEYGDRFINRILGPSEIENAGKLSAEKKIYYLAKRFAAKEAVAKSIGTGIGKMVSFNSIEILNYSSGKVFVRISESNYKKLSNAFNGDVKFHVSISDEREYALANAVAELMNK